MQAIQKQVIIPTGQTAGYLEARKIVAAKGMKLPSNVLHDDYLVMSDKWNAVKQIYPAWADEFLVYPEFGGTFSRGKDIVDSNPDSEGRSWVLPANYVSEAHARVREIFGIKKVGLFVIPEDVKEENYKNGKAIIVQPKSIIVLYNLARGTSLFKEGNVDEVTRVALEVSPEEFSRLEQNEIRYNFTTNRVDVRPLVRGFYGIDVDRRDVVAGERPDGGLGVAGVGLEEAAPKKASSSQS